MRASKAGPGWAQLQWVPRTLIKAELYPGQVTGLGMPCIRGLGKFGWHTGLDDPLVGCGMFLRCLQGR
eukprot:6810789-Alexandrium_andersonii.AAC.1